MEKEMADVFFSEPPPFISSIGVFSFPCYSSETEDEPPDVAELLRKPAMKRTNTVNLRRPSGAAACTPTPSLPPTASWPS
jgi:hypothetical protein